MCSRSIKKARGHTGDTRGQKYKDFQVFRNREKQNAERKLNDMTKEKDMTFEEMTKLAKERP